ncbi:hypothetical protein F4777DRAFT_411635 [Nemania sp. FL0916]|nr:hypothetical protein F4777DRAFT_411635 [Nemania sp. FL0916]
MHNFIATFAAILPLAAAVPHGLSSRDSDPACASTSFGDFAWNVEDLTYHAGYLFTTPAHQVSSGSVAFNLTNPALVEKVSCSAYSTQLNDFFYGTVNYECASPEGSKTKTTFAYSRPSGQLDINQTWTCSDDDPQYPVIFRAYGTANLTLDCKESDYQNPDWHMGDIYSNRDITCDPVTIALTPHDKTAVA